MIAYFDCFAGVAGDMVLGAMLDAGLPFNYLKRELSKLDLHGYQLKSKLETRGLIGGVNFQVACDQKHLHHHHHSFKDIRGMINRCNLAPNAKKLAVAIFETLARAEGRVHRKKVDEVHFHEVGAVDSIVDIVGAAIGFDHFAFDAVYASPLPVTRGFVKCEHGTIPVPAPATLEILKGVPIVPSKVVMELVTPTGASILKTVVKEFGNYPVRIVKTIGYGLGDWDLKEIPNALRLVIGEGESVGIVEANIDDMNPQIYEFIIEKLLKAGALDVTIRPVLMKKKRPGSQIQILCAESDRDRLIDVLLRESTTIGVRYYGVCRKVLERKSVVAHTKFGAVRVKISGIGDEVFNVSPEYEDCKAIALKKNVPFKNIYIAALVAGSPSP